MNSQDIEIEHYLKVILDLRKETEKLQKSDSKLLVAANEEHSLNTTELSNQQLAEDQYSKQDHQKNSGIQQIECQSDSNITNFSQIQQLDNLMLKKAEIYLTQIVKIKYNFRDDTLEKKISEYELIPYKLKKQCILAINCEVLSCNYNDTLLAISKEKNIQIYSIDKGNFELNQLLEAHNSDITSLVFSKKTNYLLSGGDDFFIHMWEELQSKQWQKKISKNTNSPISCMLLNKKENLIFVGNKYGFVQVWSLNVKEECIKIVHEMRKIHEKCIHGISLNSSENRLITCSSDNKIMLWTISQQGILTEKAVSNRQSSVYSIHFLDDIKILLTQNKIGLIELKLINDEFQEDQKIIEDQSDDHPSFSIQYNQTYNIVLIKHNRFIYIYRVLNQGGYELMNKFEYKNNKIYGTLSNDGKKLITFNDECLRVYE